MVTGNFSTAAKLPPDSGLQTALMVTTSIALCGCLVALVTKLVFLKVIPIGWKCSVASQDIAFLFLSFGLLLVSCHMSGAADGTCMAGGFFALFGVQDILCSLALSSIIFIFIQNPSKMSQLSTFRWQVYISFVIPQKGLALVLAALPVMPVDYFDTTSPYPLHCFPVRQEGSKGAVYGAIMIFLMWVMLAVAVSVSAVVAVRFWAGPGTRVHASSPSLWQLQKMEQSKSLHKFVLLELGLMVIMMFMVTVVIYTNNDRLPTPQWATFLGLVLVVLVHLVLAVIQLFLWSTICCNKAGQKKEPHHRLKQLELIQIEGPGKLRLKASWAAGKGVWKKGLLKVYGPAHIKAWAQEIVVLGLLRKSRSSSVLQCLWTSNTNPYHETMTLISGDIVSSDSRLTCLELTSIGTLQELLKTMKIPLPETCQRTIMRDVAEGLSCLHDQNVLHRNLTSATIYLKGSVQRLVIRAAIGDFEDAQIYGILTTGSSNSTITRKRFFYPDIRAYALVGIELLARVCDCRYRDRQLPYIMAVNLSSSITDAHDPSGKDHHSHDKSKRPSTGSQDSNVDVTELTSMIANKRHDGVRRFENPEVPYCAPGEPEYSVKGKEKFLADQQVCPVINTQNPDKEEKTTNSKEHSRNLKSTDSAMENTETKENKEYTIDNNWILQSRAMDINGREDTGDGSLNKPATESKWEEYKNWEKKVHLSQTLNLAHGKTANGINFPHFMAPNSGYEDLDIIEEEIERGHKKKFSNPSSHYQHGGYVTSVTEDGREIFVPAAYTLQKSRGNSSSGYGSYTGSTLLLTDHSSAETVNSTSYSDLKRAHNAVSIRATSTFDDVIHQTLPNVEEDDCTSRQVMRDLMKAKEDERIEQLIASYEERVRRGEMGENIPRPLAGKIFPRTNTKEAQNTVPMLDIFASQNNNPGEGHSQQMNCLQNKRQNKTLPAHRHKTHHLNNDAQRLRSPSNSSFYEWNAKSSLKRSKARVALRKALRGNGFSDSLKFPKHNESRGAKGKEVEKKYASIQRKAQESATVSKSFAQTGNNNLKEGLIQSNSSLNTDHTLQPSVFTNNFVSPNFNNYVGCVNDQISNDVSSSMLPSELRKPSDKTRPIHLPHAASNFSSRDEDMSDFGGCDLANYSSSEHGEESLSSLDSTVEPASAESEHANQSSTHSRQQTVAEKIESDMNEIIRSNGSFVSSKPALPLGVKLVDSGFDSVSVSSEELCLCAAATLEIPEDGSSSYPSQDRCSCACSSCLGSGQDFKQESSRSRSRDSESWSNSNSFSSYDTNMHRRKLPRMRDGQDSPGDVLAPDDQYPSPVHRGKTLTAASLRSASTLQVNSRPFSYSGEEYSTSTSETSTSASRRYRELMKRGVPLRVSIISGVDGHPNDLAAADIIQKVNVSVTHKAENDNQKSNSRLHDLESEGDKGSEMQHHSNESIRIEARMFGSETLKEVDEDRYRELSPIPSLEEIIREIPDETGSFPDEAKAFLNRPESEKSIKALQEVLSRHGSGTEENTRQSKQNTDILCVENDASNNVAFSFQNGVFGSKELASRKTESFSMDILDLQSGVDGRHVRYCRAISSSTRLVIVSELLPASSSGFDKVKMSLQQTGNFGVIGNQMLELIATCWLHETPPTMATILNQLSDNITETEL